MLTVVPWLYDRYFGNDRNCKAICDIMKKQGIVPKVFNTNMIEELLGGIKRTFTVFSRALVDQIDNDDQYSACLDTAEIFNMFLDIKVIEEDPNGRKRTITLFDHAESLGYDGRIDDILNAVKKYNMLEKVKQRVQSSLILGKISKIEKDLAYERRIIKSASIITCVSIECAASILTTLVVGIVRYVANIQLTILSMVGIAVAT